MVSLPWKVFDKLMKDAYESVLRTAPKEVAEHIRRANLEIVAEDLPGDEVLEDMEVDDPSELMGLYQSVSDGEEPLGSDSPAFPDRVIVYRKSIEAACDSLAEAKREVLLTLIHEIAHHVGFEEDAMDRWEDEIAREREGEA